MRLLRLLLPCALSSGMLVGGPAQAQLDNRAFEDRDRVQPADSQKLFLRVLNINYLRNNEYFQNVVPGYTLFGQQLHPKLTWQPFAHVAVEAGLLLGRDFGNNALTTVVPSFTFKYQRDSLSFLFGTLEGNVNHRLLEPLYGFERLITRRVENGVQLISNRRRLFLDLWVDWQRATYPGADFQERILGGASLNWLAVQTPTFRVEVPFQLLLYHQGGQGLSLRAPLPLTNQRNAALGVRLLPTLGDRTAKLIRDFGVDAYVLGAASSTPPLDQPFRSGSAVYVNFWVKTRWLDVMASFWHSNRFEWAQGGDLYRSVANELSFPDSLEYQRQLRAFRPNGRSPGPTPPDYTAGVRYREPFRNILIIRLMREFRLMPDLYLTARLEAVLRPDLATLDYSQGLYVTYRRRFLLKKF